MKDLSDILREKQKNPEILGEILDSIVLEFGDEMSDIQLFCIDDIKSLIGCK